MQPERVLVGSMIVGNLMWLGAAIGLIHWVA